MKKLKVLGLVMIIAMGSLSLIGCGEDKEVGTNIVEDNSGKVDIVNGATTLSVILEADVKEITDTSILLDSDLGDHVIALVEDLD